MSSFRTAPFEQQLQRLEDAFARNADTLALLHETAGLADPAPLAAWISIAELHHRLTHEMCAVLCELAGSLPDASLHFLFAEVEAEAALMQIAQHGLATWSLERINALAFFLKWQSRRAPEALQHCIALSEQRIAEGLRDARDLLFVSGARLVELELDPQWRPLVAEARNTVIEALARAPKSISQANAETLLARSVYADRGRFLFELMQNADDASASCWRVRFDDAAVAVEHDGKPFSFRDLVGVLSIGQTTKTSSQIGFFGVGFKSVYEVCARPRIHSGVFDVEIAHISIPREIAATERLEQHTKLILPLELGINADELHARAQRIPPETLLTLPALRELVIERNHEIAHWIEEAIDLPNAVRLRSMSGEQRDYLVYQSEFEFDGKRAEGRSHRSPILLAIGMRDGVLTPVSAPTCYSFLPTSEHTGLRVMIHARFDLTLDRERLAAGSTWNEALLTRIGELLAHACTDLVQRGFAILPILPSENELAPVAKLVADALRKGLVEQACLPAAEGSQIRPSQAKIVPAEWRASLATLDLGLGTRALAALDVRDESVARHLGARDFALEDLLGLLERLLVAKELAPKWLQPELIGSLERHNIPAERLRALSILEDMQGHLVRPSDALVASSDWATVYRNLRPIVPEQLVARLAIGLRESLQLQQLEVKHVVEDLNNKHAREQLLVDENAFFAAVASSGWRDGLAHAACIRNADGMLRSAHDTLVLAHDLRSLAAHLGGELHVIDTKLYLRHALLFDSWLQIFTVEHFAARMVEFPPTDALAGDVLEILRKHGSTWSARTVRVFASAKIFPTRQGSRRAAFGADCGYVAEDLDLELALPSWPWISRSALFGLPVEVTPLGVAHVIDTLCGADDLPPVLDAEKVDVLDWILLRHQHLTAENSRRLAEQLVFTSTTGTWTLSSQLRFGSDSTTTAEFYRRYPVRQLASAQSMKLAEVLHVAGRNSGLALALIDLATLAAVELNILAALLIEAAGSTVSLNLLRAVAERPFFPCNDGTLRALAHWDAPDLSCCVRGGSFAAMLSTSGVPTLTAQAEALLAPFLLHLQYHEPSLDDVIETAAPQQFDPDHAQTWLAALRNHASGLSPSSRQKLSLLPLFANRLGARAPLAQRYAAKELATALGPAAMKVLGRDDLLLADCDESLCDELALAAPSASKFLQDTVVHGLLPGQLLGALSAPWNQPETWAVVGSMMPAASADFTIYPLALNGRGELVRAPALLASECTAALLARLPYAAKLAHREWASELSPAARARLTAPLEVARVVEWLREACPNEIPIAGHPVIADADVIYQWLMESRVALEGNATALAVLARAAIFPSQRATLRAACDLVLDTQVPDLGLGWGLAPDAPRELVTWLLRVYPMERRQRQAIVDHVLEAIEQCENANDEDRAAALIAFLSRVLSTTDRAELEARVRSTGVRERLKIPSSLGWQKPKRICLVQDIELIASFCDPLPALARLDGAEVEGHPIRLLLQACGAQEELADRVVIACLTHATPTADAAIARARYVVQRVLSDGTLRQTWGLDGRSWMPDANGNLQKSTELFFPSAVTQSVLGPTFSKFADLNVLRGVAEGEAGRLGLRRLEQLQLADLDSNERHVGEPLLRWLETALAEKRVFAADLRVLRTRLLLPSDDGVWRSADKLVIHDTLELFHEALGEFSLGTRFPRVVAALGIPQQPDTTFIFSYFKTLQSPLSSLVAPSAERCLARLAELSLNDKSLRIPPSLSLVAMHVDDAVLVPADTAALRMFEPLELHAVFPLVLQDPMYEVVPSQRSEALCQLLLRSGVHDLWSDVRLVDVINGPDANEYLEQAQTFFGQLKLLGDQIGSSIRVVRRLVGSFKPNATGSDTLMDIACDALLHEDTLWVTPAVFQHPERVAVAIERTPQNRAALFEWLARGEHVRATTRGDVPRTSDKNARAESSSPSAPSSFLQSLRALFGKTQKPDAPKIPPDTAEQLPAAARLPPNISDQKPDTSAFAFAPNDDVRSQLGYTKAPGQRPQYGFAFLPNTLPAPWSYAPKQICARFHPNEQKWSAGQLPNLSASGTKVGTLLLRGRLPAGEQILPLPHFSRLGNLQIGRENGRVRAVGSLTHVHLESAAEIECAIDLIEVPNLEDLRVADVQDGLQSTVPDSELPEEVHAFLEDQLGDGAAMARAIAVRSFVQTRYRYDPMYLEDAAVGRWLERMTQGRTHRHIAALHAGRTSRHLGAGVCYELNSLLCELLRRIGIPSAIATGWVVNSGELCDPDHLWCVAFLRSENEVFAIPLDAAATRDGRPIRVPRRPSGKFPLPDASRAQLPQSHNENIGVGRSVSRRSAESMRTSGPKQSPYRRVPLAELERVVRHLERISGQKLSDEQRAGLEQTLKNPSAAEALLRKLAQ